MTRFKYDAMNMCDEHEVVFYSDTQWSCVVTQLKTNDREINWLVCKQKGKPTLRNYMKLCIVSTQRKENTHQNVNLNTKSHCGKQQNPSNQLRCTGARRI